MKHLALITILLFLPNISIANKIDRLKTTDDVEDFVRKIEPEFSRKYSEYEILPTDLLSQKVDCTDKFIGWGIQNWEKIDINNDNKTDLVVNISNHGRDIYTYLIIDRGIKGFKSYKISKSHLTSCELFKPFKVNNKNYLKYYFTKQKLEGLKLKTEKVINDTLTFKYDELIELQENPVKYKIKSIEYKTGCAEMCPAYSIMFDNKGLAKYNGNMFVEVEGFKEIKVTKKFFKELENLLGYVRVKDLNENYNVPGLHNKLGYLKITFDDDSQKIIDDNGAAGTYGLSAIYKKIEFFVEKNIWK